MFFLLYKQQTTTQNWWTNNHPKTNRWEKAGSDVIDIFTNEDMEMDMENTPLRFRMQFRMNFTSGVFSSKTQPCVVSIQ